MMPRASIAVNILSPVRYDPYGLQPGRPESLLVFNGEFQDRFTGNYLLGNGRRVYRPALRRFLSADHLSPFSKGGISAYAYCLGDPINRHDPSGAFSILTLLKNALWLGSRIKAAWSGPSRLKVLSETAKWTALVGSKLVSYGVPGSTELVAAAGLVKVGVKGVSTAKSLNNKLKGGGYGLSVMDLAEAEFSPFVGPIASRSSSPIKSVEQIRAA
ncbi:RHS repeat-associated core domain-containing protein [Pseudomonas sp. RV120224-01c]